MKLLAGFLAMLVAFSLQSAEPPLPVRSAELAPNDERDGARIWIVPEYYGAITKNSPYTDFPLVTKGDLNTLAGGVLGFQGTTVVFDRDDEDFGIQHGIQLTAGGWINADRKWGAEFSGLFQPQVEECTTVTLDRDSRLCIPYFDAPRSQENAFPYDPGLADTTAIAVVNKQQFWSVGAMGLCNIRRGQNVGIDLKFGLRSLNLEDEFGFRQHMMTQEPQPFAEFNFDNGMAFPGAFSVVDSFKARNRFIGADLGARISFTYGRFRAEIQPKVALGGNMQTVEIRGRSIALDSTTGAYYVRNGGFWALDTNIGEHRRTRFAVVPEVSLKVGVGITRHLGGQAGYELTYWSDVIRAGDHVSRAINVDKVALGGYGPYATSTPAVPSFRFKSTDFWAHGVTAGFTITF